MKDNFNLGEIKDVVQDAIRTRDFNRLNSDVKDFVSKALDEAKVSVTTKFGDQTPDETYKHINKTSIKGNLMKENQPVNINRYSSPVGKISGFVFSLLGAIGTGSFGLGIFVLTVLGGTIGGKPLFYGISFILLPFFLASLAALLIGNKTRKRVKRFERYKLKLGKRNYIPIEDLAHASKLDHNFVVNDLLKMIDIDMFPQGHVDRDNTYFMINDETYDQYLKLQENVKSKKLETVKSEINRAETEVERVVQEGRGFILEIKNANAEIPGEEISKKLYRLEDVTERIFDHVELEPAKLPELKKFIEYFLPTTLKLVQTYRDIDSNPIQGENILKTKKEIEDTIETINLAFEKLLDELFEDTSLDISTDISVLETMLAQEGLTNDDMKIRENKREDKNNG